MEQATQTATGLSAREAAAWSALMMLLEEDGELPAMTLAEAAIRAYRFADAVQKTEPRHQPEAAHGAHGDGDIGAGEFSVPPDEFDQRNDQYDFSHQ